MGSGISDGMSESVCLEYSKHLTQWLTCPSPDTEELLSSRLRCLGSYSCLHRRFGFTLIYNLFVGSALILREISKANQCDSTINDHIP